MLLVLVPPLPVAACDVPSKLLAGRTLSETRKVLRGEVVFVADARLHDFEGRATAVSGRPAFLFVTVKDKVEVRFRVLMGEAE
jgi:hypothetical protein